MFSGILRFWCVFVILFLLCFFPVSGQVNVSDGVLINDKFFSYDVVGNFSLVESLNVTRYEVYFDGVGFCDWTNKSLLVTLRECGVESSWEVAVIASFGLPIVYLITVLL